MQPVPAYWLYGEGLAANLPDILHIETIIARSALHNWRIEPHRHRDLMQFFLLESGGGTATIDGVAHRLSPGMALLMPPLVIHDFTFDTGTSGFVASVAGDLMGFSAHPAALLVLPEPTALAELGAAMRAALVEFERNGLRRDMALTAHARLICLWFARAAQSQAQEGAAQADIATRLAARFVELVERDFRRNLPLEEYASALAVSVPHLSRVCRAVLGRSALRVVHDRLMLEARRHLAYTSMAVSQISWALGFSDPAYFTRFFTARSGMAPSVYRAHPAATRSAISADSPR
jgi:AraC family transcriptional activator of pobA